MVTLVGGFPRRKCAITEKRAGSKWAKIIRHQESTSLSLDYKTKFIISEILTQSTFSLKEIYTAQKIKCHESLKTYCWSHDTLFSEISTSGLHPLQRGLKDKGLQVWPQMFGKQKGRNYLHNYYYCSVRYASDSVREKVAEENRKTRERFAACEKEWEKLVDERLLQPEELRIHETHKLAVAKGHFTYDDPYTGYRVMTRLRHFLRGSCCGNACRHCVYNHANVAEKERSQRVFNSSYWVDASTRPDLAVLPPKTNHVKISVTSNKTDDVKLNEECEVSDPLLFKH